MTTPTLGAAINRQARNHGIALTMNGDGTVTGHDKRDAGNRDYTAKDAQQVIDNLLETRSPDHQNPVITNAPAKKAEKKTAKKEKKARKARNEDDGGEDGEEGDEEGVDYSIVRRRYKQAYEAHDGTCGDDMAAAFSALVRTEDGKLDLGALARIASDNGIELKKRWGHLNQGQQRMNLSNVLRGLIRKGTDVKVGKQTFKGEPQEEKAPKAKPAKKAKAKKAKKSK